MLSPERQNVAHTAPRITLLILAYSMIWSGTVTRTSSFHFHSHWSCHQRPIKNPVWQKNPPNHFINKPIKYKFIRLTRHMSNLQWTNLYCPIQIYCSICSTKCPGALAISSCVRDTVAKKVVVPKSQLGKSHWVGLVLHWGWENVPQVWEHRWCLGYNYTLIDSVMEAQDDR